MIHISKAVRSLQLLVMVSGIVGTEPQVHTLPELSGPSSMCYFFILIICVVIYLTLLYSIRSLG
jgi:hypothetical protein